MSDRYFFDKRDWKRRFIKYGIIFAISFLPIVLFNMYFSQYLNHRWLVILLDSVILLVFVVVGNIIAKRVFEKQDAKLERIQKEREELKARKKQIMEDSYKKIRLEKEKKKQEKKEIIVEDIPDKKTKDNKRSKK